MSPTKVTRCPAALLLLLLLLPGCECTSGQASAPGGQGAGTDEPFKGNLARGLAMAQKSLEKFEDIQDYTCTFRKRERVGGELLPEETIVCKVRHEPFSVYLKHTAPDDLKGQEALYVKGKNGGRLVAHSTGIASLVGTVQLPPDGFLAMAGNRHPITSAGMRNLLLQLQKLAVEQRDNLEECEVKFLEDQEVNDRPCRCLQIVSPRAKPGFRLAKARIYLDEEWNVPVRYEAYEFPEGDDTGEPILVEQYIYENVKFNQGLTNADFSHENEAYDFP